MMLRMEDAVDTLNIPSLITSLASLYRLIPTNREYVDYESSTFSSP